MLLIYEVYTISHQMLKKPLDLQHVTIRADTCMRSM